MLGRSLSRQSTGAPSRGPCCEPLTTTPAAARRLRVGASAEKSEEASQRGELDPRQTLERGHRRPRVHQRVNELLFVKPRSHMSEVRSWPRAAVFTDAMARQAAGLGGDAAPGFIFT